MSAIASVTHDQKSPPPQHVLPNFIKIALKTNEQMTEGHRWFCAMVSSNTLLGDAIKLLAKKAPVGEMMGDNSEDLTALEATIHRLDFIWLKCLCSVDLSAIFPRFPRTKELVLEGCTHLCIDNRFKNLSLNLLPLLEMLNLSKIPNFTDDCLIGINELPHLRILNLSKTGITDAGLAYLKTPRLTTLNIRKCTQITDKGLQSLLELPQLQAVHVIGCDQITAEGLRCLSRIRARGTPSVKESSNPQLSRND
jgi:Leucine Rich repeat